MSPNAMQWVYTGSMLAPMAINTLGQLYDKLANSGKNKQMAMQQAQMMQQQMQNGASAQQAAGYVNQNPNMWR